MEAQVQLYIQGSDKRTFKGRATEACFLVAPDEEEVYDKTYKTYKASFRGLLVEYTTYNEADRLRLTLDGEVYEVNGIDGGCDAQSNG